MRESSNYWKDTHHKVGMALLIILVTRIIIIRTIAHNISQEFLRTNPCYHCKVILVISGSARFLVYYIIYFWQFLPF